ncbi:ATP-binding domain-containing protein [Spirosoma areae]
MMHILKGSAGTGKTFLTRRIVSFLLENGVNVVQVAPTGKAAKNMALGGELNARTIHSTIYKLEQLPQGLGVRFLPKPNDNRQFTIYLVDESSMISDKVSRSERFQQSGALLSDLVDFAKRGNDRNKFLFVGDPCQLPPVEVGEPEGESPALTLDYLSRKFSLVGQECFLSEPMRAKEGSYILDNATYMRDCILQSKTPDSQKLKVNSTGSSWETARYFEQLYDPGNSEKAILIANSNKDVNYWNRNIRKQFGYEQDRLHIGDQVVVNQTWQSNGQTIYNSETGYVRAVGKTEQYASLMFADVQVEFQGIDGKPLIVETKTLLNTLSTELYFRGMLDEDAAKNYHAEMHKHTHGKMETSPFYNPIQFRFGYALTCHKAQGSEWDNVIIHRNAFYGDRQNTSLRWRYTAMTRARHELYTWAA